MRTFERSSEDYHWVEGTLWHKDPKILLDPSSSDFLLLEWRSSAYRTLARNVSSHRYLPVLDHPSSQNWASCSLWLCKFNYISVFWRVLKDDHQYSSIAQKGSLLGLSYFLCEDLLASSLHILVKITSLRSWWFVIWVTKRLLTSSKFAHDFSAFSYSYLTNRPTRWVRHFIKAAWVD